MVNSADLDARIKRLAKHFSTEEVILAGGLAVYLETQVVRDTDDADIIVKAKADDIGRRIFSYQRETGTRVDHTFPDNVFDSMDLSDEKLRERATKTKQYETGETISYLGAEALIVSKLTSFCVSGDPNQPSTYGVKVLRDKDLDDVRNLLRTGLDEDLLLDLYATVPHLEEVDSRTFNSFIQKAISEPGAPLSFTKNAFGVARWLAADTVKNKEAKYQMLLESSRKYQTIPFSMHLDELFSNIYS